MASRKAIGKTSNRADENNGEAPVTPRLFTLKVLLLGYESDDLDDDNVENGEISRTIAISGDQTLEDLHWAIFKAFDRYDEHLYEFQMGKKPQDRNARKFVAPEALEWDGADLYAGVADETTIESLGLKKRGRFFYWFDYGDSWWHKIAVESIDDETPSGKFPKVIERVGKSPPQYPDADD